MELCNIKGTVQKVKSICLYFELETDIRIYGDIKKPHVRQPKVGDEIFLSNPQYFNGNIAIIGPDTTVNFSDPPNYVFIKKEPIQCSSKLLELYKAEQIIEVDTSLRRLEQLLVPETLWFSAIISLQNSANIKLSKITFITVENLSCHDDPGKCTKYREMPNCCVQVNTDGYFTEYLYGIFDIDPIYGWHRLTHGATRYPVRFCNTDVNVNLLNRHVLVKEWTFITEWFQETGVSKISYLLLDFKNVYLMQNDDITEVRENKLLYRYNEHVYANRSLSTTIQLIRKSGTIYGYNKSIECWLEIIITRQYNRQCPDPIRAFAILKSSHFDIWHMLKEGMTYNLYHNSQIIYSAIYNYKELYGLRMGNRVYNITPDVIFHEISPETPAHHIYNGSHITELLMAPSSNQMVTVSFTVLQKMIKCNSFKSKYIFKRHENMPFIGIPGHEKQMQLDMKVDGSIVSFYSTDWFNHVYPLGIHGNVTILAKNVQVYRNQYLKATVFTTFEIVRLSSCLDTMRKVRQPLIRREAIISNSLSLYEILPAYCVVRCRVILLSIVDLQLIPRCVKCKVKVLPNENCRFCFERTDRDLVIKMILFVQNVTLFRIKTELADFLYKFLEFKDENEVNMFCNSFFEVDQVHLDARDLMRGCKRQELYQSFLIKSKTKKLPKEKVIAKIKDMLALKLRQHHLIFDAVCEKQEYVEDNEDYIPWKMIDFDLI